jgi:glycosyltransferase involved in cell wall biosynthesis
LAKVLLLADAGCHSGFAKVSHEIFERLVRDYGHDVSVLAVNYRGDFWPSILDETKPTLLKLFRPDLVESGDVYGLSRVVEMLGTVEPDVVVIINDANIILSMLHENTHDPNKFLLRYKPILTYVPVDGYEQPPQWADGLHEASKVVAMSEFGRTALTADEMTYHGVDTKAFHPVSDNDPITLSNGKVVKTKKDCKRAFGFNPDGFTILRIDKNSGRKDFAATVKAIWPVMEKHADVHAHLHTADRESQSGVWISSLLSRKEYLHSRFSMPKNFNTFKGWAQEDIVGLLNAADVFVTTSRGEGFGLTISEAAACGIPIVAQNVSAITEVVGPGGILIDPIEDRDITVPSGQDLKLADIPAFTKAIEHLYQSGGVRRKLGEAGREHVLRSFSWDTAAREFDGYLTALSASSDTSGVTNG